MHLIIIGGGEVGYALARTLSAGHDVVVVDHDAAVGDRFSSLDVEFLLGSGTSTAVLRRAGMERCDLLVACTGLDEVNVVACALANRVGSPKTICLVSKDDFLQPDGGGDLLRDQFGIDRILWPEAQLADDIVRVIRAPGAIDAEAFLGGRVRLLEYRLEAGSPLARAPLAALKLPAGSLAVAVKRGDAFLIPRGKTQLASGDKVFFMGTHEAMHEVQSRMAAAQPSRARQLVTIIGGGDVGFRVAEQLDRSPDIELRVIESNPRRGEMLAASHRHQAMAIPPPPRGSAPPLGRPSLRRMACARLMPAPDAAKQSTTIRPVTIAGESSASIGSRLLSGVTASRKNSGADCCCCTDPAHCTG